MIDHILSCLELADRYEANARRHQSRKNQAPNWQNICAMCLKEARREREHARKLATDHGLSFDNLMTENADERRAERLWSGDLHKVTVSEILRCAVIARSSTIGSRRLGRAVQRLISLVEISNSTNASSSSFGGLAKWSRSRQVVVW